MKIKFIYINGLHNAVNKTYNFQDINYIYGSNGIGKSTILQAIQYALLGYIPGTAKNSKEAILRHSPKGEISVELTLTDGTSDVVIQRKINKAVNQVNVVPMSYDISNITEDIEIPIFNFNEFVGQTANKLKEYFIKNILPTTNGDIDWEKVLAESIADCNFPDKQAIIDYGLALVTNLEGNALSQVITANTTFKDAQSYNKTEMQRLQNTIDSLIYYDDYIGPTDLGEINSKLLALGSLRDQMIKYNSAIDATRTTTEEITKLEVFIQAKGGKEYYDSLHQELAKYKAQFNELSEYISGKQNALAIIKAQDAASDSIIQSKGVCPYTKDSCKSIIAKIEDLRNESVTMKASMVTIAAELEEKNKELNDLNLKIRKCESDIMDFNMNWGRLDSLKKMTSSLPDKPDTDKTIYEINAEIETLTDSKSKLESNIRYNETIDNITKLKYEVELKGQALNLWAKKTDTNGLQTTLMVEPFNVLANTMTDYIRQMYGNDSLKAHFNVSSKANSFSFGMIRDNIYIPYDLLSSGEKCLYSLALMICIINRSKSPLKVMLCDDMFDHLDSTSIENTFATLKNIKNIQFIFAGVKACENANDVLIEV